MANEQFEIPKWREGTNDTTHIYCLTTKLTVFVVNYHPWASKCTWNELVSIDAIHDISRIAKLGDLFS